MLQRHHALDLAAAALHVGTSAVAVHVNMLRALPPEEGRQDAARAVHCIMAFGTVPGCAEHEVVRPLLHQLEVEETSFVFEHRAQCIGGTWPYEAAAEMA